MTDNIYKAVGGAEGTNHPNDEGRKPHTRCVGKGICHYRGAVLRAVEFVLDQFEEYGKDRKFSVSSVKDSLIKELMADKKYSLNGFPHSIGSNGVVNGIHVEDMKKVVDQIIEKKAQIDLEKEAIKNKYNTLIDEKKKSIRVVEEEKKEFEKDKLQKRADKKILNSQFKTNEEEIERLKENLEIINESIERIKGIIEDLKKVKFRCDSRLKFTEEFLDNEKKSIENRIAHYESLLQSTTDKFLEEEYNRQLKHLRGYLEVKKWDNTTERDPNQLSSKAVSALDNYESNSSLLENKQQKIIRLQQELSDLELQHKADNWVLEEKIVNELSSINLELNYLQSLPELQALLSKAVLIDGSEQINSYTHYGFDLEGKKYAVALPDPDEDDAQQTQIKKINNLLGLINKINHQNIVLKAKQQALYHELGSLTRAKARERLKRQENFLLTQGVALIGFDRYIDGRTLTEPEKLLAVLIAIRIDHPLIYDIGGLNEVDALIEHGLAKLTPKLKHSSSLEEMLSAVNNEYADEGRMLSVVVFDSHTGKIYPQVNSSNSAHPSNVFLLKNNNQYFHLKHQASVRLAKDAGLHLKLKMDRILSELISEPTFFEILARKRLQYHYKEELQSSDKLANCYQAEAALLERLHTLREFNGEFSAYYDVITFYYLSNLDQLEIQQRALGREVSDTSLANLLRVKDLYKSALIQLLSNEQQRRNQTRVAGLTAIEQEEKNIISLIQHDETREKQLLEQLTKKQQEILTVEGELTEIMRHLQESEELYLKQIQQLQQQKKQLIIQLDGLNQNIRELNHQSTANQTETMKLKQEVQRLKQTLAEVDRQLKSKEAELEEALNEKKKLNEEKIQLETDKSKIGIDIKANEEKLSENQAKIQSAQVWMKLIENLNAAFLKESVLALRSQILQAIEPCTNLKDLLTALNKFDELSLTKGINVQQVFTLINGNSGVLDEDRYNLWNSVRGLVKTLLRPLEGSIEHELKPLTDGTLSTVKKFKICVSGNVSYAELHTCLKSTVEKVLRWKLGGLLFEGQFLKIKEGGINSLEDLPAEIKTLVQNRIKINYPQHEWESRKSRKYEEAVKQFNELQLGYQEIVRCYVDEVEVVCVGIFLLDSDKYYPGMDLTVRARGMKCGQGNTPVSLITNGANGLPFKFAQASDGTYKRRGRTPEGCSGYEGEFGQDGQHAGNISIKIDDEIEHIELIRVIELCGGQGALGQLGGNGDKGAIGIDGG